MDGLRLYVLISWKTKTYQLIIGRSKVKFYNNLRATRAFYPINYCQQITPMHIHRLNFYKLTWINTKFYRNSTPYYFHHCFGYSYKFSEIKINLYLI